MLINDYSNEILAFRHAVSAGDTAALTTAVRAIESCLDINQTDNQLDTFSCGLPTTSLVLFYPLDCWVMAGFARRPHLRPYIGALQRQPLRSRYLHLCALWWTEKLLEQHPGAIERASIYLNRLWRRHKTTCLEWYSPEDLTVAILAVCKSKIAEITRQQDRSLVQRILALDYDPMVLAEGEVLLELIGNVELISPLLVQWQEFLEKTGKDLAATLYEQMLRGDTPTREALTAQLRYRAEEQTPNSIHNALVALLKDHFSAGEYFWAEYVNDEFPWQEAHKLLCA